MKFKNQNARRRWNHAKKRFKSHYSLAVLYYAERWATMMENGFTDGKFDHIVAEETKRQADKEELTNNMFCCAVRLLANVWFFGEELRQWHNIVRCNRNLTLAVNANVKGGIIFF